MARLRNPPKPKWHRREGGRMDAEALDGQLLARGLGTHDLAKLTGLDIATVGSARRGNRVSRQTVLKIVDALTKIPIRPEVAALVGVAVPAQNGEKKTAGGSKTRRKEVAAHARSRPNQG